MIRAIKRNNGQQQPARDLSYIVQQGARTRRHRYLRDYRTFFGSVFVTILLQAAIYVTIIMRAGRLDWPDVAWVVLGLACVPIVAAATLTAFRRNESPIVTAVVVAAGFFSVTISVLSAARLTISYTALSCCLPIVLFTMSYANLRLHQALDARVALAPFPRAKVVAKELGDIRVLAGPEADIGSIEILLIDLYEHHREKWLDLLAKCYLGGIEVQHWTTYLETRRRRVDVESFDVSHVSYDPSQILYARAKRVFDLVGMIVLLPIALPVALTVAAYIYMRDPGPVLFVQTRQGYGGRPFPMYKFRTMYVNTTQQVTGDNDNRIIPGCGFLRKFRLDELPQFYNILWGDMSLIGPRPVADYVYDASIAAEPRYALRLLVLPGITGWAQVNSGYAATTNQEIEKLSYDLYYIKHLSLDLDLSIIFRTIKTLVFRSGAR